MPISPTSELPYVRLASIALRQHNFPEAISWSRRALLLATNSAEAHYLLGRASLESGDDGTAPRELETASRLSPASPEIHFNLAKAYTRAKMREKAEREGAIFSQLNEVTEDQRSQHGTQIYAGPFGAWYSHEQGRRTMALPLSKRIAGLRSRRCRGTACCTIRSGWD
jgi:tetratricopeptide (TPR) repeat protein